MSPASSIFSSSDSASQLSSPFFSSYAYRTSRRDETEKYCAHVHSFISFILVKGLVQDPYMAARAGVEPRTLRLKAIDSTKALPCLTCVPLDIYLYSALLEYLIVRASFNVQWCTKCAVMNKNV